MLRLNKRTDLMPNMRRSPVNYMGRRASYQLYDIYLLSDLFSNVQDLWRVCRNAGTTFFHITSHSEPPEVPVLVKTCESYSFSSLC